MKYIVLIMDGAAGLPLPAHGGKTSLELARTPNLDAMAATGLCGLARTVPPGLEPDSAVACMSIFGYDPQVYYSGRAPIEARSLDIPIGDREVLFRCNLVTIQDGIMKSHSAGYISTGEDRELITFINEKMGSERFQFYPGISYRNILKVKGMAKIASAICTPPHDIPGRAVADYLPRGAGSAMLRDLMARSQSLLSDHPVNKRRLARGELPANSIWLFWGSGKVPVMPAFQDRYHLKAAVTSGVGLLRGLGKMAGMDILEIPGVTDGLDNDYAAQAKGAREALKYYDIVMLHIEAPDEAGHSGSVADKVASIEWIDSAVAAPLRQWRGDGLRMLVISDHPTPIPLRTHTGAPVPFLLWGDGFRENGARRFTETEGQRTGLLVDPGWQIMGKLIGE